MEWNDQLMDEGLRKSAASLEENYPAGLPPAPELWTAINAKRKNKRLVQMQLWSAAASTLLLVTAITIWVVAKKDPPVPVSQYKTHPMPATENEAMAYIQQACMGKNIACHSPAFQELQSELDASSTALTDINQQLKLFGNDEQLLRAKTRIKIHQARIVKAMLQIL